MLDHDRWALRWLCFLMGLFMTLGHSPLQARELSGSPHMLGSRGTPHIKSNDQIGVHSNSTHPNAVQSDSNKVQIAQADDQSVEFLKWFQTQLKVLGLYAGRIDGVSGPMTLTAWQDFAHAADVSLDPTSEAMTLLFFAASIRRALQVDLADSIRGAREFQEAEDLTYRAGGLQGAGRYAEAIAAWERALQIRERWLGGEHPDVAMNLFDIAQLYVALGRYSEAISLLERALAIQEKSLGPDHPDVATTLNALANAIMERDR